MVTFPPEPLVMLPPDLVAKLIKASKRNTWGEQSDDDDDTIIDDFAGGNADDAYAGGVADGKALMAREVLTAFGISWNE